MFLYVAVSGAKIINRFLTKINFIVTNFLSCNTKFYSAHGDCYRAMTTSTDFFAKILAGTKTRKSHGQKFHRFIEDENGAKTRFDNFKKNMKRLGLKFDLKGCKCDEKYKAKFQSFASDFDFKNPTGKIPSNHRRRLLTTVIMYIVISLT